MTDDFQSWLDEALNALILDRQRSLGELLAAYDALEEQAISTLSAEADTQHIVDVQRELAVLRLTTTKQRRGTAVNALDVFARCERLGYASADARVTVCSIFAQICLADGHAEVERGELDDALLSVPVGKYPSIEELARDLRASKQRS